MMLRLHLKFQVTSLTINSGLITAVNRLSLFSSALKPELIVNDVTRNLRRNWSVIITNKLTDES